MSELFGSQSYLSLKKEASTESVINKSRFIGFAAPAGSEDEAKRFIADIAEMYPDASHVCHAYIIGPGQGVQRFSDAGEPSGTAGMPILGVLKQKGLTNSVCAVVRYFGGILLGAGGLVRAYSGQCALSVDAAGIAEYVPAQLLSFRAPYTLAGRIDNFLQQAPCIPEEKIYEDTVKYAIWVREGDAALVRGRLNNLFDGRFEPEILAKKHIAAE